MTRTTITLENGPIVERRDVVQPVPERAADANGRF